MEKRMATPQEKAQCVEWFIKMRSDTQVHHNFRTRCGRTPSSRTSIREWYKGFKETGSCQKQKSTGRPSSTSAADDERVRESFQQSPRKSLRWASRELWLPTTTGHRILKKRLNLYAYKVQILQELKPNDDPNARQGYMKKLWMDSDETWWMSWVVDKNKPIIF